jgi:hypothetical protein
MAITIRTYDPSRYVPTEEDRVTRVTWEMLQAGVKVGNRTVKAVAVSR